MSPFDTNIYFGLPLAYMLPFKPLFWIDPLDRSVDE